MSRGSATPWFVPRACAIVLLAALAGTLKADTLTGRIVDVTDGDAL